MIPFQLRQAPVLLLCVTGWFVPRGDLRSDLFVRGDLDASGKLELTDAVRIFGFLFLGSPSVLSCGDAADTNDSGALDITDGIYLLNFLFSGGRRPATPFPDCGDDTSVDDLDCVSFQRCRVPACEGGTTIDEHVDVGGYGLRVLSRGRGCPTIVMDGGLSATLDTWSGVLAAVSEIGQTVIYDRAGLGDSDPGPPPRTSEQISTELRILLANAGFEPPYVLVGHSFGGMNVRLHAMRYPEEVAGLVLEEPSNEYYFMWLAERFPELYEDYLQGVNEFFATQPEGARREWESFAESLAELAAGSPLPDVPLVVLTSLKPAFEGPLGEEDVRLWYESHERIVQAVSNGTHITTKRSGHFIHSEEPQLVIDAIAQVVEAAK